MIRPIQQKDIVAVLDIYNYYVLHSTATFDIEPLSLNVFTEKVDRINSEYPFLVFEENGIIEGYAYGSKFRPKPAYKHTVESTVYVRQIAHGRQIGTKLYSALLELLKEQGFYMVLGILTIPNEASIKLHEKFGFKKTGELKELGFKFGALQDVGIWQLKL